MPKSVGLTRSMVLAGAGVLFAWLVIDRDSDLPTQIAEYLKSGTIGEISPQEQNRMATILRFVESCAVIDKHLLLNGEVDRKGVHVYVTTPAAERTTGCATGNAVYAARLDAIFLDRSLVRVDLLERSRKSIWSDTLGFQDAYLALILLHELGHRQLHGRTSGAFDRPSRATESSMQRELEADRFALTAFKAAPNTKLLSLFGPEHIQPMMWLNIDPESIPNDEKPLCNLAASIRLMTDIAFAWDSPFGTLYHTTTHPPLADRTIRVLDTALGETKNEVVRRQMEIAREDALRFQSLIDRNIRRFRAQRNLVFAFIRSDDAVAVDEGGAAYRLPLKTEAFTEETPTPFIEPLKPDVGSLHLAGLWAEGKAGLVIIDRDARLWKQAGQNWQETVYSNIPAGSSRPTVWESDVYRSPDGQRAVLLLRGNPTRIALFTGAALTAERDLDEVEMDVASLAAGSKVQIRLNCFRENAIFGEVYRDGQLSGIAEFSTMSLKPTAFHQLRWDRTELFASRFDKIFVIGSPEAPDYAGVTTYVKDPHHGFIHGIFAFRLYPDRASEPLINEPNMLVDFTPENASFVKASNREPHFGFDGALACGEWRVCIAIDSDSVYSIDLSQTNRRVKRVFHPGRITIGASSDRSMFLFSEKGAKAGFLASPE